ncbi:uncharacterized protein LOC110440469 isoform X2 [Mizuhopecten yessoensis]|uniref:uncharacterized protein LOC110440469 isoform X2 n=1 Tax=Mizuhopecten yessoensis TaxID=6573 RepID=UPI000B45B3AD|nr:uncharacterized protein LOC110440469 isoform X2 [Mizuhopecten yessoensis]
MSTNMAEGGIEHQIQADDRGADTAPITFEDLGIPDAGGTELPDAPFGLGKRRSVRDLQKKEYVFIVLAGLCLLVTLVLTIWKLATLPKTSNDFSFALVLLLSTVFCLWYLVEGIMLERPYEILVLSISTFVVWLYIILNFSLGRKDMVKMVRLIVTSALSPFMIVLGVLIAKHYFDSGRLIFRTVGAQSFMQRMCRTIFGYFGMLKFDLQLSLSMVILILTTGQVLNELELVIVIIGIVIVFGCALIGYLGVRCESKILSIIYSFTLIIQPCYVIYKIVESVIKFTPATDSIAVPTMVCGAMSLGVRLVLIAYFVMSWLNYGKGLKEKVYHYGYESLDTGLCP